MNEFSRILLALSFGWLGALSYGGWLARRRFVAIDARFDRLVGLIERLSVAPRVQP